jgi:hypothetical protein
MGNQTGNQYYGKSPSITQLVIRFPPPVFAFQLPAGRRFQRAFFCIITAMMACLPFIHGKRLREFSPKCPAVLVLPSYPTLHFLSAEVTRYHSLFLVSPNSYSTMQVSRTLVRRTLPLRRVITLQSSWQTSSEARIGVSRHLTSRNFSVQVDTASVNENFVKEAIKKMMLDRDHEDDDTHFQHPISDDELKSRFDSFQVRQRRDIFSYGCHQSACTKFH